jgi:hypothetical protein
MELKQLKEFDVDEARNWYNGINIDGNPVYNTYSMMSFLDRKKFDCYWGMSGSMNIIKNLLNDDRWETITKLMRGEEVSVPMNNRISLERIRSADTGDESFYSLLAQGGYLSIMENSDGMARVCIPNEELLRVWKSFILEDLYKSSKRVRSVFDNVNEPKLFEEDLEYFLTDRMSYHDLASYGSEPRRRVHERAYHIFILGLLSAFEDMGSVRPLSNRESGDGRYDIMVESRDVCIIFELKACNEGEDPKTAAEKALAQIDAKRYGTEVGLEKKLVKVGIGFQGKQCSVRAL